MSTSKPKRGAKFAVGISLLLAVGLAALGSSGCRSLPKPELELELRALEKNAPLGSLQRKQLELSIDEETQTFEFVYLHEPALSSGGEGDAVPVVLIHGTPSTLFSWTELIYGGDGFDGLRNSRDVYAIEIIGHGIAPGSAAPYSFERCAKFVGAALEALELEQVHLVGSSYGGEFVWRTALNEPQRISSIVLMDSSGFVRRDQDWLPEEEVMRDNSLAKIGWMLNSRDRITTALEPHFDSIPPGRVDEFFLVCENAHNWKAMIDLARDENGEREAEIGNIQAPALILWGANDIAYPLEVYGERFAREIPGAELVALPETGHYPHEQRPQEVLSTLTRFFNSVPSKP